ncbi:MAG: hypothetical protein ACR2MG_18065 [Pyrinomonadaceae bacterium]
MNRRNFFVSGKMPTSRFILIIALFLLFGIIANSQSVKQKKWTYDFSEVIKYFDTPLEACQSYTKEKYPNDNYKASVEATNDPETYRCSADDTYFGLVYKTECKSCDSHIMHNR